MFLNIIALLTAIAISGVAAYYSIVGLTAIFSGVFIPIIIMGGVLEVGKIVTTVWLHVNWHRVNSVIKYYLSFAVVILMFVTSMGIFGFLSRAHIDATSSVGDNQLLIEQIDQTIAVERQRITDSRAILTQMDSAINNILNQSANARTVESQRGSQIATQANTLRNQQKKERDNLNAAIDAANKRIADVNVQKLKFQQAQAKVEAEVGPIKYIAQLIYGDQVNKDLLERAVRWVIIIIVAVFDPLAVCLVLAVTMAITFAKRNENEQQETERHQNSENVAVQSGSDAEVGAVSGSAEGVGSTSKEEPQEPIIIERIIEKPVIEYKTIEVEKIVEVEKPVEVFTRVEVEVPVEVVREVEKIVEVKVEDTGRMLELAKEIDNLLNELNNKEKLIGKLRAQVEILEHPDDIVLNAAVIGSVFPEEKTIGQLFCLIENGAIKVFKWNDEQWIPVNKEQNDSYLLDDPVTDGIITMLATGEILWENLTPKEQEALEPLLKDDFKVGR